MRDCRKIDVTPEIISKEQKSHDYFGMVISYFSAMSQSLVILYMPSTGSPVDI